MPYIRGRETEAVEPGTAEDELRNHEHETEFGFVNPFVQSREIFGRGIGEEAGEDEAQERADKGARVHVSGLHFVEGDGREDHYCGEDDADEDCPAD